MKITEHLEKTTGETVFSFEILPPLKGFNINSIYENIDPLMEFNPPFIDVTYHREEYVYSERENGLLEKRSLENVPELLGSVLRFKANMEWMRCLIFFAEVFQRKTPRIS